MTPRRKVAPGTHREPCEKCGEVHPGCAGHKKATGKPCGKDPIKGGTVCTHHGGRAPQVEKAAKRNLAKQEVVKAAARLGGSIDANPIDVLLEQVREAAANVTVLRDWIREMLKIDVDHSGAIAIPEQVVYFEKGGTHVPAAPHIMVTLYNQERDRLVKYAKLCLDAGVEERRVQLAELQGRRLSEVVKAAVEAMKPTDAQRADAFKAAAAMMKRIGAGS